MYCILSAIVLMASAVVASEGRKSVRTWVDWLAVPDKYADFRREVRKTGTYTFGCFDVECYEQACGPGLTQQVMMAVPKNAKTRLPAMVVPFYFPEAMLGFEPVKGSFDSPKVRFGTNLTYTAGINYMADLSRRGYITISADAYHLTYAKDGSPADPGAKWAHVGSALKRDWPEWTGMGKLVFDTGLLVDMLSADDRVDPERIGVIGHSLGGKMAFYLGCLDPRVKLIVASDFGICWDQTNWSSSWYWGDVLKDIRKQGFDHRTLLELAGGKPFCLIAGKYDDKTSEELIRSSKCYDANPSILKVLNHASGHRPPRWATREGYDFIDRFLRRTNDGRAADKKMSDGSEMVEYRPLGEPGLLPDYPERLPTKPTFRRPQKRGDGLVLVDGDRKVVVVSPRGDPSLRRLADELKYHLEKMSGKTIASVDLAKRPPSGPVVVFGSDEGKVPEETMIVRRSGDELYIGGDGAGISHALTYVLEALGCRYLWPGALGKVIPRKKRIVLPEMTIEETPRFRVREISIPSPGQRPVRDRWLPEMGVDPVAYAKAWSSAQSDAKGNRGFWQWHGVNDGAVVRTRVPPYGRRVHAGHYFTEYHGKFAKEHPDWFALQPDGVTRGNRLCLSNPGLQDEVVRDRIEYFRKNPDMQGATICMPDGSYDTICFCEDCRKWDPVNSEETTGFCYVPKKHPSGYVALTDRVLTFANIITERVVRECPGKNLVLFSYSHYNHPPVKVKPHPSLVFFNVAGDYRNVADADWAEKNLAAWLSFGNPTIWRPNILNCFGDVSDKAFRDIELMGANGVIGIRLDCGGHDHASRALTYYIVAKAMMNTDRLDYDTYVNDFCTTGFGKAAPAIHEYYEEYRKAVDLAAQAPRGENRLRYIEILDLDRNAAILARAKSLASGDADALRRIAFLEEALNFARETRKLYEAWSTGDLKGRLVPARAEFKKFASDLMMREPNVVNCGLARGMPFIRGVAKRRQGTESGTAEKSADEIRREGHADSQGNFVTE